MRLGISSYTYGWTVAERRIDAFGLIERAVTFGVRLLQICDNLPAETYGDANVAAIAERARRAGVAIELGTRGCGPTHLSQFVGHAVTLGSPVLRVVLDDRDDHPSVDEVVERVSAVRGELESAGVTLAIENHDRFKARQLVEIVERVDSERVGICLDTVNSFGAMEGPEVVVATLGPHVANLHLKDFAVRRFAHLQGFTVEGRPAGEGMLDVPWVLERMRAFGKGGISAIAELWVPPEGTMDQTIAKESQWAEQSVRTLRRWIGD